MDPDVSAFWHFDTYVEQITTIITVANIFTSQRTSVFVRMISAASCCVLRWTEFVVVSHDVHHVTLTDGGKQSFLIGKHSQNILIKKSKCMYIQAPQCCLHTFILL